MFHVYVRVQVLYNLSHVLKERTENIVAIDIIFKGQIITKLSNLAICKNLEFSVILVGWVLKIVLTKFIKFSDLLISRVFSHLVGWVPGILF